MGDLEYKVGDKLKHNKGYTVKMYYGSIVEVVKIDEGRGTVLVKNNNDSIIRFLMEDMDRFFSNYSS